MEAEGEACQRLQPIDKVMVDEQKRYINAKVAEAKKWGVVNLRDTRPSLSKLGLGRTVQLRLLHRRCI